MTAMAICSGLTVFLLTVALLARHGEKSDRNARRLRQVAGSREEGKRDDVGGTLSSRLVSALRKRTSSGYAADAKSKSRTVAALAVQLEQAGIMMPATTYQKLMTVLATALPAAAACICIVAHASIDLTVLSAFGALVTGILVPRWVLAKAITRRQERIVDDLPAFMDQLVVSAEAGLGFDASIMRLIEKGSSPINDEFATCYSDITRGVPRREAMNDMARRCNVKPLSSFVSSVVQAEQLGVSIKPVLQSQAETLRRERRQRVEKKALTAPIKMLFPTVGFIFPVLFIIMLGPAVANMASAML